METKEKQPGRVAAAKRRKPAQASGKSASAKAAPAATKVKKAASGKTAARKSATRTDAARKEPRKTPVKKKTVRRAASADVVYTPPKPFNRSNLLMGLATAVAVVLALTFGISIFFSVDNVIVSGTEKYDAWTVMQASGIEEGSNLLTLSKPRAAGKIKDALPYVDSVRIGIKLPDTVNIEIKELDVWYAIRDVYEAWWLITAEGRVIEQVDAATAGDCTKILGIQLAAPHDGGDAVAVEPEPSVDESGVTLPVTVRGSDQLNAALSILQYLESNGIIGDVVSVDVSDMSAIELWYGQQYQVNLGDTTQLSYKISCLKKVVDTLPDYESGEIDLSFTTITDQPVFKSFS